MSEVCACGNQLPFAAYRCFACAARRVAISTWFISWIGLCAAHELREGPIAWRSSAAT